MVLLREFEVRLSNFGFVRLEFGDAEDRERVLGRHARRLLLHLELPRLQHLPQQVERVEHRPVGELGDVAEVPQVIDITEELVLERRVADHGDGAVLVQRAHVGLEARREVGDVVGDLLDHELAHLVVPDGLRSVEVAQEDLGELVGAVVDEVGHHGVGQHLGDDGVERRVAALLAVLGSERLLDVRHGDEVADA